MAQAVVLYDRDCNFCMVTVVAILAWDRRGRLRAAPIHGAEGAALLGHLTPAERLESFHLAEADGTVTSGGPALTRLAGLLRGGAPLRALLGARPGLTDRGYRWVARHRVGLSKAVPGALKDRARARLLPR